MASSLLSYPPVPAISSPHTPRLSRNPLPSLLRFEIETPLRASRRSRPLSPSFAVAEPGSPKSIDDDVALRPLLQELAASLDLPPDYLARLPRDLRLDLNDAAFDLSNGAVLDECGLEIGEILLSLSRAWEKADTSTSNSIAGQLPSFQSMLTGNFKSAFGKRLIAAGRRFGAMGLYGQGELQRISKAMIETGKLLSASPVSKTDERPEKEARMFKFGELQVALTPEKANIGAAIAFVFGILSWELLQGIQSIPESSMQYANDNALILGKSLRGALIAIFFSSTFLSAFASVGLVLLGRELSSDSKSKDL